MDIGGRLHLDLEAGKGQVVGFPVVTWLRIDPKVNRNDVLSKPATECVADEIGCRPTPEMGHRSVEWNVAKAKRLETVSLGR